MADPTRTPWHRFTTAEPPSGGLSTVVVFGSDLPTEADLKLIGDVEGRRVLDLGCGTGHNSVVLALHGAKVIAVDPDTNQLAIARERAELAEVRVELHQAGLAELAFLRSDSLDAAISVMALATSDDLARVFRQVHRVLKPEAPLVCSFPHPAFAMFDPTGSEPNLAVKPYDQNGPITWQAEGQVRVTDHPRTIGEIFTALGRANFRVDQILEPTAPSSGPRGPNYTPLMKSVPATLLIRARKQGN